MYKRKRYRRCYYAIAAVFIFVLTACSATKYEKLYTVGEDNRVAIIREGVEYDFYGFVGNAKLTGKQIGIVDDDKDYKVFQVNGYEDTDWLLTELNVFMEKDSYSLYKAQSVKDIPEDFALDDDAESSFLAHYQ